VPGQVQCQVGHRFAPESLSQAHKEALERTLLKATRMLNERSIIHQNLANSSGDAQTRHAQERFSEHSTNERRDLELLQDILKRL
jgi:hypothetical protein